MNFLKIYRKYKEVFVKPKLYWFFGKWKNCPNLPVWRRGCAIRLTKNYGDYNSTFDHARFEKSEWTEVGKKNHPILSKIFKPVYYLPIWLSFYFFDTDIFYKIKNQWEDEDGDVYADIFFEAPAQITLVFFGWCISITAGAPVSINHNDEITDDSDYWESILAYQFFNEDVIKACKSLGRWKKLVGQEYWEFNPDFIKDEKIKKKLIEFQQKWTNE